MAREVWEQLKGQAGASGAIDDVKATVRRITERLKETLRALKEEKVEADRRSAEKEARRRSRRAEAFDRAGGRARTTAPRAPRPPPRAR